MDDKNLGGNQNNTDQGSPVNPVVPPGAIDSTSLQQASLDTQQHPEFHAQQFPHKSSKKQKLLIAVCSVVLLAGLGVVGYMALKSDSKKDTPAAVETKTEEKLDLPAKLKELADAAHAANPAFNAPVEIKDRGILIKDGDNIYSVNTSTGYDISKEAMGGDEVASRQVAFDYVASITAGLKEVGFKDKFGKLVTTATSETYRSDVILENDEYWCNIYGNVDGAHALCSPKSGLAAAKTEQKPFIDAIKASEYGLFGDDSDAPNTFVAGADLAEVKDSPKVGYEVVSGGVSFLEEISEGIYEGSGGAAAMFFREKGSDWQFFVAAQSIDYCETFADREQIVKDVYADFNCLDEADQTTTIGAYFN